ncbi:alcohol dehydrogenase catalytic domain-containing protein [Granulicoccus phenolivorans]|uniref:alcohol dehydrogenase catalytic domain-containing protein n=1 Tax=Granulicoccus phenolivorans TaxID=266854 RepID=UPI00040F4BAA|nr:alcohol dehydrogenase catalytic domain-containing protein [Granulicoccus phenolivorans]
MTAVTSYALASSEDHNIEEMPLEIPTPQGHEVVVKVTHSGVCHTDIHVREGGYDLGSAGRLTMVARGVKYPLVMGHEIAGTIIAIGPDVTDRKVGDDVVVYPWLGCGECSVCATGNENLCVSGSRVLGIMRPGGYAQQVLVPHEKYAVALDGVDPAWGATTACSGITAVSAVAKVTAMEGIAKDAPVVVLGTGGVGLMCIAALRAAGMTRIIALDRSEATFEKAKELGATVTAVVTDDTTPADIVEIVGEAPQAWIDVVNSGRTFKLGFDSLRKGGRLVPVGLFGGEVVLPTAVLALQQKSVTGNYVGGLQHLHQALQLARDGLLPRVPLITQPLSVEALQTTLDDLEAGRSRGRVVLTQV